MPQLRVVVVDDSALMREVLTSVLSADEAAQVVGTAANGREAVRKVLDLNPDIVIMDLEMPVMNGVDAIEEIMNARAVPILVLSSLRDAHAAYAAISKGALEVLSKSEVDLDNPREFIEKVKSLSKVKVISHIRGKDIGSGKEPFERCKIIDDGPRIFKMIAIASSTGGPKALSMLLSQLPSSLPVPVVIAQHISEGFVSGMVDWLKKVAKLRVKVAEGGDSLVGGSVYVSPSDKNMRINLNERVALVPRKPGEIYHPSCNVLLSSAADVYKAGSIGVILTGMGDDGVDGIKDIRDAGGITIAQDEKTSAVFGMPRVAIERGYVNRVLPLEKIAAELVNCLKRLIK